MTYTIAGASNISCTISGAASKRRLGLQCRLLGCGLLAATVVSGCQTPVQEESFLRPFDAQRVAQLSHEAFKVAWDATVWARHDLRFAAFRPTALDYEVVSYLNQITQRVPWVALKAEKNPASPRVSSKNAYDVVAYDAMMLRLRYQPTSFRHSTDEKIEYLLSLLDGIAPYYEQKSANRTLKEPSGKNGS